MSSGNSSLRVLVNDHSGHPFQVQLSRSLARRGHTVLHTYCRSFLTPRGSLERKAEDPGGFAVKGIALDDAFDKYNLVRRWLHERELGWRLNKVVREFAPDVVVSSNTPLITQALLQAEARRLGAGFVFWMQNAFGVGYRNALRRQLLIGGDFLGRGFQWYEQRLLARSDEVVVITDDFLSYLPMPIRRRNVATVIENWAPLDELPLKEKQNDWSIQLGLDASFNFLYSGTLGLKHNPNLLIDLAKAVAGQAHARVVVVSEGPGAQWLAEHKQTEGLSNLVLLPFQPFEAMPNVLASADVLLTLLEKDAGAYAVPSKVLTYLCAQRPLLLAVPSQNLSAKIVRENAAGLTVDPDDAVGFMSAGLALLANSEQRKIYARNGRAYAERTFHIEQITDRFEDLITRIATAKATANTRIA